MNAIKDFQVNTMKDGCKVASCFDADGNYIYKRFYNHNARSINKAMRKAMKQTLQAYIER